MEYAIHRSSSRPLADSRASEPRLLSAVPPQNPVERAIVDVFKLRIELTYPMLHLLYALLATARSSLNSQRELALENLALRQQLAILQRKTQRPRLTRADRAFWVALCRLWPDWHNALLIVKPQTVIGWHRKGFKLYWSWKSRNRGGRPPIEAEVRTLIRRIASENPTWGAPRIHGDWSTPSPTTRRRSTSSGTETRSMARTSFVECVRWESSRSSPRRGPHGRIHTASA
jgi:hypothetical protein